MTGRGGAGSIARGIGGVGRVGTTIGAGARTMGGLTCGGIEM